jgi:PHD/YefM family antitoxin component YafN of YafNO toxin-antitoxin module
MTMETNSRLAGEQYIVDEKGNPTAVILSIEDFRSILGEIEDYRELKNLSQSAEFARLIRKGLDDVKLKRVDHWKDAWDDP